MPEKNYQVKITAGLINSIFCNTTGDVQAIIATNDLHQVIPMFRDWMRLAIRHPDGTHMTPEEADAVFDEMPINEYLKYISEIILATTAAAIAEAQEFECIAEAQEFE